MQRRRAVGAGRWGGVRVEVSDGSPIVPRWTPAAARATSACGSILVQRPASAWGVERHGAGKTVRAVLEQPADVVQDASGDEVLALWTPDEPAATSLDSAATVQVVLTVDVAQMLDRRAHVEDLTREPQLLAFSEPTARAMAPVVQLAARLRAATTSCHQG